MVCEIELVVVNGLSNDIAQLARQDRHQSMQRLWSFHRFACVTQSILPRDTQCLDNFSSWHTQWVLFLVLV
jgi:hypothetical protein